MNFCNSVPQIFVEARLLAVFKVEVDGFLNTLRSTGNCHRIRVEVSIHQVMHFVNCFMISSPTAKKNPLCSLGPLFTNIKQMHEVNLLCVVLVNKSFRPAWKTVGAQIGILFCLGRNDCWTLMKCCIFFQISADQRRRRLCDSCFGVSEPKYKCLTMHEPSMSTDWLMFTSWSNTTTSKLLSQYSWRYNWTQHRVHWHQKWILALMLGDAKKCFSL